MSSAKEGVCACQQDTIIGALLIADAGSTTHEKKNEDLTEKRL